MESTAWWRGSHAFGFLLGGTTFIAGTGVLFVPNQTPLLASVSAALYTLGSVGFLYVDVLEFFTFTTLPLLRANISLSALGSTLYVVGSVGFFPALYNVSEVPGVWGFILGSAFIAVSQVCKLVRIGWSEREEGFALSRLTSSPDSLTSTGTEGGAALGATFFLVGTLLLWLNAASFFVVVLLWTLGSLAFTTGGLALAYRHFVLQIT
jgi:hypothetical protein